MTPAKTILQGRSGGTTKTTQSVTVRWVQLARGKKCTVVHLTTLQFLHQLNSLK